MGGEFVSRDLIQRKPADLASAAPERGMFDPRSFGEMAVEAGAGESLERADRLGHHFGRISVLSGDREVQPKFNLQSLDANDVVRKMPEEGSESVSKSNSYPQIVEVTPSIGLNVREGPSIDHRKLGALPQGTQIEALAEENGWLQLEYQGQTAYVSGQYTQPVNQNQKQDQENVDHGSQDSDNPSMESPGTSFESAISLGDLTGQRVTENGMVGREKHHVYYSFSISEPRRLQTAIRNLSADASLDIYDGSQQQIHLDPNDSNQYQTNDKSEDWIGWNLQLPGIYFVRVSLRSEERSNYDLIVNLLEEIPTREGANQWILPWGSSPAPISQSWHADGYKLKALDFAISAGTPIVAPIDSIVASTCNAGKNHRAIKLQASDGKIYSLIHLTASDQEVFRGRPFSQGEVIGTIAPETNSSGLNTDCARTLGVHLHMGFPEVPFSLGDKTYE